MRRNERAGLVYYTFDRLSDLGVIHVVASRLGGVSRPPFDSLNVGHTVGDAPEAVAENLHRLHRALDLDPSCTVTAHQAHGTRVASADRSTWGTVVPSTDGLTTDTPQTTLLLRFADCVPIFVVDPSRGAIGLGHAGWRGTADGLATRLVKAMVDRYGSEPDRLLIGLGPGIAWHHYPVSPEVASRVAASLPEPDRALVRENGSVHLDLWEANRQQLVAAGVPDPEVMPTCTGCHRQEFFSHRVEGPATGRFAALLALQPESC